MAILTISREFRSGGQEVGSAVAERMRYDYVGKERILSDLRGQGERWITLLNEVGCSEGYVFYLAWGISCQISFWIT